MPSRASSGHQISCCLVSIHFPCDILLDGPVMKVEFTTKFLWQDNTLQKIFQHFSGVISLSSLLVRSSLSSSQSIRIRWWWWCPTFPLLPPPPRWKIPLDLVTELHFPSPLPSLLFLPYSIFANYWKTSLCSRSSLSPSSILLPQPPQPFLPSSSSFACIIWLLAPLLIPRKTRCDNIQGMVVSQASFLWNTFPPEAWQIIF